MSSTTTTPTGRAITESIREQLSSFTTSIPLHYSRNMELEGVLEEVAKLPEDALVLFGVFNRDAAGRFYDVTEASSAVAERSKAPVYGLFDFDIGQGIVGGVLISGYAQGQSMAQRALHVLSGRHPRDVPVIRHSVARPMFDYRQLKRFGIKLDRLPADSEILNRPRSFYSEYTGYTWLGAGFAAIQTLIIMALIINITRRRQAEKDLRRAQRNLEERVRERTAELRGSEEALRTVFDSSHDAIFIHDARGRILEVNQRMLKMYGLFESDIENLSIEGDISSRDNAVYRLSTIWRSAINGEPQHFDWRARRPHTGEEFDVEVYLTRMMFRGREAILANVRDISVRKESENRIRRSLTKFEAIFEKLPHGHRHVRRAHDRDHQPPRGRDFRLQAAGSTGQQPEPAAGALPDRGRFRQGVQKGPLRARGVQYGAGLPQQERVHGMVPHVCQGR